MEYISVMQFAEKFGISERTARNYCASGKIEGAFLTGKTWNIPADAVLPQRKNVRKKVSPLLTMLREQKASRLKGGIYHRTQIDLTYNSNHIEGRIAKDVHVSVDLYKTILKIYGEQNQIINELRNSEARFTNNAEKLQKYITSQIEKYLNEMSKL